MTGANPSGVLSPWKR